MLLAMECHLAASCCVRRSFVGIIVGGDVSTFAELRAGLMATPEAHAANALDMQLEA